MPHFDRAILVRCPGLISEILKVATDDREYDLLLLSSLTVLSTIMPGVSGMLKNQLYKPPFYTLIVGPSGSGKGSINVVRKLADPWQNYVYDVSKAQVKEYEEKITGAEQKIDAIERRIFDALVEHTSRYIPAMKLNALLLAQTDVVLSPSVVASEYNSTRPVIPDSTVLAITAGRPPVIDRRPPPGEP